jgi:hypothetical protein
VIGELALAKCNFPPRLIGVRALGIILRHEPEQLNGFFRLRLIAIYGENLFEMAHRHLIGGIGNIRVDGMQLFELTYWMKASAYFYRKQNPPDGAPPK